MQKQFVWTIIKVFYLCKKQKPTELKIIPFRSNCDLSTWQKISLIVSNLNKILPFLPVIMFSQLVFASFSIPSLLIKPAIWNSSTLNTTKRETKGGKEYLIFIYVQKLHFLERIQKSRGSIN